MDAICEAPEQMPKFGITQEEGLPELMLPKQAHAWLEEFMNNVRGKEKYLPEPSNFHVNMTYFISHVSRPNDQPPTMEGNYSAAKPMMTHVNIEEAGQREPG